MSEWYYTKGEQRHGPVATDELNQLAASGVLDASDLVWREGMTDWLPASGVEGLTVPNRAVLMPGPQSTGRSSDAATVLLTDFKVPQTVMATVGLAALMTVLLYLWSFRLYPLVMWLAALLGVWLIIMSVRLKAAFTPTTAFKSVVWLVLIVGILPPLFAILDVILDLGENAALLYAIIILPVGAYSLVKMREMMRATTPSM
jgi:hypothetical protein